MHEFKAGDKIIVTQPGSATGKVFTLEERQPEMDILGEGKAWTVRESFGWLGEAQFELYTGGAQ